MCFILDDLKNLVLDAICISMLIAGAWPFVVTIFGLDKK